MVLIDINEMISDKDLCLVGEKNGKDFYQKIESKIKDSSQVFLIVPDRIVTMNRSFFIGCFSDMIEKIGKDRFLLKVKFSNPEIFIHGLEYYVNFVVNRNRIFNTVKIDFCSN